MSPCHPLYHETIIPPASRQDAWRSFSALLVGSSEPHHFPARVEGILPAEPLEYLAIWKKIRRVSSVDPTPLNTDIHYVGEKNQETRWGKG